jgi:hypothetical protein
LGEQTFEEMIGLDQRLEAVDRMCTQARAGGTVHDLLVSGLASSSGLHPSSVGRLVWLWLERCQRGDLARIVEVGRAGAIGTVGVVAPGNLCVATWQPMIEALLCGNQLVVRPGSGDPLAAANLKRALALVDGDVAACIEVATFARHDRQAWRDLLSRCDTLAAYGSDEAVAAVQALAEQPHNTVMVRRHGHKVSLAWLPADLVEQEDAMARWAEAFAHDVLVADGRGCMSLRALLTDVSPGGERGRDLMRHLAQGMATVAAHYHSGSIVPSDLASRRLFWEEAAFGAANTPSQVVVCRDVRADWGLVMRSTNSPLDLSTLGPGSRYLAICSLAGPVDLQHILAPLRGHLSTLARPQRCAMAIEEQALAAGFTRLCTPGRMQAPAIDEGLDGHRLGALFVRSSA